MRDRPIPDRPDVTAASQSSSNEPPPRRASGAMMALSFEWPIPTRRPSRALVVPVLPDEDEEAAAAEHAAVAAASAGAAPAPAAPPRAPAIIAGTPHVAYDQIGRALHVLLTPLDYADATTWASEVAASMCTLLATDGASLLLPDASAGWFAWGRTPGEFLPYETQFGAHDHATERMRELRLGVAHQYQLWSPDELHRNPVYHEYMVPAQINDAIGMRVRAEDRSLAGICLYRERARDQGVPEDAIAALHALKPAFRAGVSAWRRVGGERAGLAKLLDTMTDAALLYDTRGTLAYSNPAAQRMLPVGADGERLREAAQRVAWAVAAVARRGGQARPVPEEPATREVALGTQRWALRGAIVGEGLLGRDPAVLVTITPRVAKALDDAELAERFDLTPREIEIARCLAAGLQNKEIGARLGISTFTARNHVEKVLGKLGVDGRAKVGMVLRGE